MKPIFTLFLCFLLPFIANAQVSGGSYWEAGVTAGPMVFMGDLGGNYGQGTTFLKDYNLPVTRLTVGAFATVYPDEWLGIRFMINHGELYGNDALVKAKSGEALTRKFRNLDFRCWAWASFTSIRREHTRPPTGM